ncbi:MAG TPA: CaiB/BaiF CoA-transferase family protein [Anaerolineae bacterium]|nr:CaiB/BaiF CoA-transferase family protein [Anaerolineae bacterium]
MTGALAGLKVLDFSTMLPGPWASLLLADMGAEVLRVEAPTRPDPVRFAQPLAGEASAWHYVLNRSKRSLALDLKQAEGVAVVKRLVATYDIVITQVRPGVMERLGVGYEALRAINPALIYCAITGYGQTGPYRSRAGHDNNYMALSGLMSYSGRVSEGPSPLGFQAADVGGGGMGAVMGILAAVIARGRTGRGQFVDVSMFDMMVSWNRLGVAEQLVGGEGPVREGGVLNGGGVYDYYRTADDRFLAVGSLEPKFWAQVCTVIERPDLLAVGLPIAPDGGRGAKEVVAAVIGERPLADWIDIFAQLDACVEPVLTVEEMLAHPQTVARELIVDVPHGEVTQPQVGLGIRFSESEPVYRHTGRAVGADSEAVLAEVGYDEEAIKRLRNEGVLG